MTVLPDLAALAAFRDSSPEDLTSFVRAVQTVRFAAKSILLTQAEPADGALLLVSGRCRCEVQNGERRLVLGRIGPGELIGEPGLYTAGLLRSATVIAEEDVVALKLERTILDDPRAAPILQVLEQRALASLAERVRRNSASMRRHENRPAEETQGSFMSGLMRAFRRLTGS